MPRSESSNDAPTCARHCAKRRTTSSLSSCRRSLGRTLAGARIGVRALAADRQAAAMAQAAIAAEVHQPLDVHRDLAAQVALDHVVAVDGFADLEHFGVGQLVDAALGRDADLLADLLRQTSARCRGCTAARSRRACSSGMLTPAIRATSSPSLPACRFRGRLGSPAVPISEEPNPPITPKGATLTAPEPNAQPGSRCALIETVGRYSSSAAFRQSRRLYLKRASETRPELPRSARLPSSIDAIPSTVCSQPFAE